MSEPKKRKRPHKRKYTNDCRVSWRQQLRERLQSEIKQNQLSGNHGHMTEAEIRDMAQQVIQIAQRDDILLITEIPLLLGVSEQSYYSWAHPKTGHPDFAESHQKALRMLGHRRYKLAFLEGKSERLGLRTLPQYIPEFKIAEDEEHQKRLELKAVALQADVEEQKNLAIQMLEAASTSLVPVRKMKKIIDELPEL